MRAVVVPQVRGSGRRVRAGRWTSSAAAVLVTLVLAFAAPSMAAAAEPTPAPSATQLLPQGSGPAAVPIGPNAGNTAPPVTADVVPVLPGGVEGVELAALALVSLILAGVAITTLSWMLHAWRT
ncbi:MAG: hypothetical protein ABIR34_11455, partial [Marmoricola sp.]